MKTLKTVWPHKLTPDDWNFSRCPADEVEACFFHEYHREAVQLANGGTFPTHLPRPAAITLAARLGVVKPLRTELVPRNFPAYLSRPVKERRRKQAEKPRPMDELTKHDLHKWLGDEDELAAFYIPWTTHRDEDIVDQFEQWLADNRPDTKPEPPKRTKPVGAATPERQAAKKLKALAAWRVLHHHKGKFLNAICQPDVEKVLGRQFNQQSAWSEATATVQKVLQRNFGSTCFE